MFNNIFLFTGEEVYLLHQELHRWRQGFLEKYGPDTVFSFSFPEREPALAQQAIFAGGLFVDKKLIIINNLPTSTTDKIDQASEKFVNDMMAMAGQIGPDTLLVFTSPVPDKRTKFTKFLLANAQVKEFKKLSSVALKNFIKQQLQSTTIDDATLTYMIEKLWSDAYHLSHECDKLLTRSQATGKAIDAAAIDQICYGQTEHSVFDLFDKMFTDMPGALHLVDHIHEESGDRNQTLGALYWTLKMYVFILDQYAQGIKDSKELASKLWYPPFAISKALGKIKVLQAHEAELKNVVRWLVDLDLSIKTGKLPDTIFRLQVKKLLYSMHADQYETSI
jgi:DNA polymerase III delta subunit